MCRKFTFTWVNGPAENAKKTKAEEKTVIKNHNNKTKKKLLLFKLTLAATTIRVPNAKHTYSIDILTRYAKREEKKKKKKNRDICIETKRRTTYASNLNTQQETKQQQFNGTPTHYIYWLVIELFYRRSMTIFSVPVNNSAFDDDSTDNLPARTPIRARSTKLSQLPTSLLLLIAWSGGRTCARALTRVNWLR